jgi:hypothetical protein
MKFVCLVPLVLVAACFDASNAPSCTIACATDSECPDGQTCNASAGKCTAGEDCASPQTCVPNEFVACVDGAARSCNDAGDGTVDVACGAPGCNVDAKRCNACVPSASVCSTDDTRVLTCADDGSAATVTDTCIAGCVAGTQAVAAHCRYLEPKWLPDICDMPATMDTFMPNASATYSSDLDTNCTGGVVTQTPGRPICVVRAKTITIPSNITLTISGQRPIAFVADESLTVNGTLDAAAQGTVSGPGGGQSTSGTGPTSGAGGGGAGFAQAGAAGGDTGTGNGNPGGATVDPLTLAFFGGGPRAASASGIFGPNGGGGGGALTLIACRGRVTLANTSTIDVGGGGGGGQRDEILGAQISIGPCGAGGGAGGYVAVQGLTGITMAGGIYANGGGGGGGSNANDTSGDPGGDGPRSTTAGGNGGTGNGGGNGGDGGFRGGAPRAGGGSTSGSNGAGGGGSMGFVHVFAPAAVTPSITNTNMSPTPLVRTTPTR